MWSCRHTQLLACLVCMLCVNTVTYGSAVKLSRRKQLVIDKNSFTTTAAIVGLECITDKDVRERVSLVTMRVRQHLPNDLYKFLYHMTLDSLIEEKLKVMYAKKLARDKELVSFDDVLKSFNQLAEANEMSHKEFEQHLSQLGVNKKTLLDQIYARLTWEAYTFARYSERVSLSEEEIQREHKKICTMLQKRAYNVDRFYVNFSSEAEKESAKKTVNTVVSLIRAGVNFQDIIRQFSINAWNVYSGSLGLVSEGQLPFKEENDALKTMKVGEIKIVQTRHGFSVLRLNQSISAKDDNGELLTVHYVSDKIETHNSQNEISAKLEALRKLTDSSRSAADMLSKAKSKNMTITPAITLHSKYIEPQLKHLLNNAKNGITAVAWNESEVFCACIVKKQKVKIDMPTKDDIKNKMFFDQVMQLSSLDLNIARRSINVEKK